MLSAQALRVTELEGFWNACKKDTEALAIERDAALHQVAVLHAAIIDLRDNGLPIGASSTNALALVLQQAVDAAVKAYAEVVLKAADEAVEES